VKAYPKVIKTLKVNGKKVKVTSKKHAYAVTQKKFKKRYAKVKLSKKKGWKIDYVYVDMWNDKGEGDQIKVSVSTIKKGGKIRAFLKKHL
jgi:polyribonucleotide nucleotidyltransferase